MEVRKAKGSCLSMRLMTYVWRPYLDHSVLFNLFFGCGKGKTNEIADLPSYDMKVVMQIEPRHRPDPGGSDFSKIRQSKGMHSPGRVGVGRSGRCARDTIKKGPLSTLCIPRESSRIDIIDRNFGIHGLEVRPNWKTERGLFELPPEHKVLEIGKSVPQRLPAAQAHWALVPQTASALEAKHAITPPFR
ncbi:hypothetical protein TIFTF001_043474, partial [Ficus carica]